MTGGRDEFIPSAGARRRRARERAAETRRRRWGLIGGAVAGAAFLGFVIVLASGGDDAPKRASDTTRTTTTTRVRRTTTTTTAPDDLSTTTSTTPPGGAEVGPGPGSSTESNGATPPVSGAPADPTQGGVTVSETPGACRYNSDTSEVEDSGTVSNPGTEEATVEVEVTWSDATGEFDSWSDVVTVPAGGSADWSVSTAWVDAPQGLTCQTALI